MRLGTTAIANLKLGTTQISSVYLGTDLIWSSFPIPTPTVWLDSDSTYLTLTGSRVTTWDDRSGNDIDAVETSSSGPTIVTGDTVFNGENSLDFLADDGLRALDDALLDSADGFTTYIVTKLSSFPSTYNFLSGRVNTGTWTQGWGIHYQAANWRFWVNDWNTAANRVDMGAWTDFTNAHIFKFHYDKVNITAEIIGPAKVDETTKAFTTAVTAPSTGYSLASDNNSASYDCPNKMATFLFYNSPLSSGDQTDVETYLKDRFDITNPPDVVFDAYTTAIISTQNTNTFAHTCGGSNRYLVVKVMIGNASSTVSTATYNGVSMTKLQSTTNTGLAVEMWGLVAPASGSNNVVVSYGGPTFVGGLVAACSYANVDQVSPVSSSAPYAATSSSPTNGITSAAGDMAIDLFTAGFWTITPSKTQEFNISQGGNWRAASNATGVGGTTTMGWTVQISSAYCQIIANLTKA